MGGEIGSLVRVKRAARHVGVRLLYWDHNGHVYGTSASRHLGSQTALCIDDAFEPHRSNWPDLLIILEPLRHLHSHDWSFISGQKRGWTQLFAGVKSRKASYSNCHAADDL